MTHGHASKGTTIINHIDNHNVTVNIGPSGNKLSHVFSGNSFHKIKVSVNTGAQTSLRFGKEGLHKLSGLAHKAVKFF